MSIRHTGATSAPPASGARAYAVEIVRRTRELAAAERAATKAREKRDAAIAAGLRAGLSPALAARAASLSIAAVRVFARAAGIPPLPRGPKPGTGGRPPKNRQEDR